MEGSIASKNVKVSGAPEGAGEGDGVPETARRDPDAPDSIAGSIARAREQLEKGGSILDLAETEEAEAQVAEALEAGAEGEAPEAPEEEGAEGAEEELERPDLVMEPEDMLPDEALPEGWEYDDNRRLHRKDGTMASLQEHEDLRRQWSEARGEEAPEGELEEETEGAEEEEGTEPEGDLVVELPGREEGETFPIEAADPETAERLRQLANGYQRGEEHKRQMQQLRRDRQEFREVTREFEADPAGFLAEKVSPEIQEDVLLRLLGDDDVFDRVSSKLRQWEINPEKKRADLNELKVKSRDRRDQVSRDSQIREAARGAARTAREHMETLVREAGLQDGPAARKVMKDGMSELGQAMMEARRFDISLDEAKAVLRETGTLDLLGLSANGSGARSSSRGGSSKESASTRRVRAVDPSSEEAKKARRAGEEMQEKVESRRAAAASPQGAGASAATQVTPPEGQSVEERIEWAKKKGLGAILGGQ